jgi:hypothetical protein
MQYSKLVTLVLLSAILSGPLTALSLCVREGAAKHPCVPHCPMKTKMAQAPQSTVQASHSDCCQVSPARPFPEKQSFVPTTVEVSVPAAYVTYAVLPWARVIRASDSAPPPCVPPSQSALCTFLI